MSTNSDITTFSVERRILLFIERSQSLVYCIFGEFSNAMNVQLSHDLSTVGFDSFHADAEVQSDRFRILPLSNELYYFTFPRG